MFAYTFILKIRADPNSIFQKIDNIKYIQYTKVANNLINKATSYARTYVHLWNYFYFRSNI